MKEYIDCRGLAPAIALLRIKQKLATRNETATPLCAILDDQGSLTTLRFRATNFGSAVHMIVSEFAKNERADQFDAGMLQSNDG